MWLATCFSVGLANQDGGGGAVCAGEMSGIKGRKVQQPRSGGQTGNVRGTCVSLVLN